MSPFYRRIFSSLSPADFTTARRLSVSAFIGRPTRARLPPAYISIPGTDSKKERAEFIYKHYPRENDKVESFHRPKTVKRLLPARPRSYFNYADLYAASSFHSNKEMLQLMFMSGILEKRTRESSMAIVGGITRRVVLEANVGQHNVRIFTAPYVFVVRNILNCKFSPKILLVINTCRARLLVTILITQRSSFFISPVHLRNNGMRRYLLISSKLIRKDIIMMI